MKIKKTGRADARPVRGVILVLDDVDELQDGNDNTAGAVQADSIADNIDGDGNNLGSITHDRTENPTEDESHNTPCHTNHHVDDDTLNQSGSLLGNDSKSNGENLTQEIHNVQLLCYILGTLELYHVLEKKQEIFTEIP